MDAIISDRRDVLILELGFIRGKAADLGWTVCSSTKGARRPIWLQGGEAKGAAWERRSFICNHDVFLPKTFGSSYAKFELGKV